jgi:hypothetical protein
MLRLLILTVAALCAACEETGQWPGGGGGGGAGGDGPGAEDLLVNGGFERLDADGAFAARWTDIDDNPDGDIALVEDPVHGGQRAVEWQIEAGDGREYWIQQTGIDPALFEPGERYQIAGWYRASAVEGDISFSYIVRGDDGGDLNITNDWDDTHPTRPDTWEPFGWQFTIPDDADPANYAVMFHLIKWTGAELRFQIDDVTLRETR